MTDKAQTVRLKMRVPDCGAAIDVETVEGQWEPVQIKGSFYKDGCLPSSWILEFDDGSTLSTHPGNVSWRWTAQ